MSLPFEDPTSVATDGDCLYSSEQSADGKCSMDDSAAMSMPFNVVPLTADSPSHSRSCSRLMSMASAVASPPPWLEKDWCSGPLRCDSFIDRVSPVLSPK